MGAETELVVLLLFILTTSLVFTQDTPLCGYFTAIPKEPRPDDLLVPDLSGTTWSTRPLLPPPERHDVCMDVYTALGNVGTQIVHIDEEIQGDVIIAKLNYYGLEEPYIGTFLVGQRNLLQAVIRREPDLDNDWYLVITESQDYESPDRQFYIFNVNIQGEALVARVQLEVVNIDDNDPVINVFDACSVPELGSVPRLTECVYEVTDADGEISTRFMTFSVDSERGDDEVFSIYPELIPNDWYRMNMTIQLDQLLDFETSALHIFSITAFDSLPNTHTVSMMVQVQNVESRPPRWVETWPTQQFDEKTSQQFRVRAIDGDTGIDKPILYRLEKDPSYDFFSIETLDEGRGGAIFSVAPIDRDTLQQEIFQLSIVAYKFDNESFATSASVVIIVDDVNDQIPEPLHDEYTIQILEETPLTLNFEDEFGFYDRDLGEHAQYSVHLESVTPPGAADAFYIAPNVGYQRQTFTMGTTNHSMLDYELPEFQHIELRVVATDLHTPSHVGIATVYIDLINWNDEQPIFVDDTPASVSFDETVAAGYFVATVRATDRDIDDRVVHSLMGNAVDYLRIDEDTGDIFVSVDDAFDYHRQSQLFVQVRADDTLGAPYNTITHQLTLELNDINNTPPTLRLPRGSPLVEENVPQGFVISDEISATDPDTTASLVFEIDWETSYATKQGRETPAEEFHNCVEIQTFYPNINSQGVATGHVVAREIRDNVTIDFEEFEVLYLTVRVRDLNTVLGDDSDELTFTVIIVDMNDNPPVWAEGTLDTAFRVREVSDTGVVIGSVLATDIDGPLYNQVRYTIFPRDDTPDSLVQIDFYTGQITVMTSGAIDADEPPRDNLYYTVIASDRCYADNQDDCPPDPTYHDTPGNITIHIIDTNNKRPEALTDQFNTTVYIYENATSGDDIVTIVSSDRDRDVIYHTVAYQINYIVNSRLRDFFEVDLTSGRVYVNYTTDDVLDRDGPEPEHRIFLTLIDNFYSEEDGNRNQMEEDLEIYVILLDVNDNAPELPPPDQLPWVVSENVQEGIRVLPEIWAPDADEPDTDNSRVGYEILSLTAVDRDLTPPELFIMINIDNVTGELETNMPLRGYWGTYDIFIRAYDHGIPQMSSQETYSLVVTPYNYHAPEFIFPIDGATVRLSRDLVSLNSYLTLVNGDTLESIVATDDDGLHAGEVSYSISGDDDAQTFFNVQNPPNEPAFLVLSSLFPEQIREFQVIIRATDGGTDPGPLFTDTILNVVFVPTSGDPVFSEPNAEVAFFELEGGLEERFSLPEAVDPKNHRCDEDCHDVFYWIFENSGDAFAIDHITNEIYLTQILNRSESTSHIVTVIASNSETLPGDIPTNQNSVLTVTITVREANPRPIFARSLYTAGISALDSIGRQLLTVLATHTEGAAITYTIDEESMVVDPTLEASRENAFILNGQTGVLTLNYQPSASMHGMFEFNVVATDTAGLTDSTEVKIFLISTLNRVTFIFYNTLEHVEAHTEFIRQTFSSAFGLVCNIDQIVPASDNNGNAVDDITEVRAHFIEDDMPVDADTIDVLRSDTELLRSIRLILINEMLNLEDLVTGNSPVYSVDSARVTVYVLAVLSAILAFLCLVLLLTFIVRTRALNRRLEALSTTKFGSIDSGLNRAGVTVPGTNKHTVEGSNPIYNEQLKAPDFDAISEGSDNSDLIGIEDMPQFKYDYFPEDGNMPRGFDDQGQPSAPPAQDVAPTHSKGKVFGFNSTPFSPEFSNRQFNGHTNM